MLDLNNEGQIRKERVEARQRHVYLFGQVYDHETHWVNGMAMMMNVRKLTIPYHTWMDDEMKLCRNIIEKSHKQLGEKIARFKDL